MYTVCASVCVCVCVFSGNIACAMRLCAIQMLSLLCIHIVYCVLVKCARMCLYEYISAMHMRARHLAY